MTLAVIWRIDLSGSKTRDKETSCEGIVIIHVTDDGGLDYGVSTADGEKEPDSREKERKCYNWQGLVIEWWR